MSLKLAEEAHRSYREDIVFYSREIKDGVHNPALVALDRMFCGQSVNTEFYIDKRIQIERQKS